MPPPVPSHLVHVMPSFPPPPPYKHAASVSQSGSPRLHAQPPPLPLAEAPHDQVHRIQILQLLEALQTTMFTKKKEALDSYQTWFVANQPRFTLQDAALVMYGTADSSAYDRGLLACCGQLSWKQNRLRQSAVKGLGLLALLIDQRAPYNPFHSLLQASAFDYSVMKLMRLPKHLTSSSAASSLSGNLNAALKVIDIIKELRPELIEALLNDPDIHQNTQKHQQQRSLSINMNNLTINAPNTASLSQQSKLRISHTLPGPLNPSNNAFPTSQSFNQSLNQSLTLSFNEPLSPLSPLTPRSPNQQSNEDWKARLRSHLTGFFATRPAREELEKTGVLQRPFVFGQSLEQLSQQGSINPSTHVPYLVEELIAYLSQKSITETPGLFRLSGESCEITTMKQAYDSQNLVTLSNQTVHSICGLFKMLVRELPEPIFTFDRYESFIDAFRAYQSSLSTANQQRIEELIDALPLIERCTLDALLSFLAHVSTQSSVNLMTPSNLSICWAPNLVRPSKETLQSIARDSPVVIGLVAWLIQRKTGEAPASTAKPSQSTVSSSSLLGQHTHHAVPPPLPQSMAAPPPSLSSIRAMTSPPPLPSVVSPPRSPRSAGPPPLPAAYTSRMGKEHEEVKEETRYGGQ